MQKTTAYRLRKRAFEARRSLEQPWRAWYKSPRWLTLRAAAFRRDGYRCQRCGRERDAETQLHADHRTPHRGNARLFWHLDNLQTLCAPCHNSGKHRAELYGYDHIVDARTGLPTDPRHPFNRPIRTIRTGGP